MWQIWAQNYTWVSHTLVLYWPVRVSSKTSPRAQWSAPLLFQLLLLEFVWFPSSSEFRVRTGPFTFFLFSFAYLGTEAIAGSFLFPINLPFNLICSCPVIMCSFPGWKGVPAASPCNLTLFVGIMYPMARSAQPLTRSWLNFGFSAHSLMWTGKSLPGALELFILKQGKHKI